MSARCPPCADWVRHHPVACRRILWIAGLSLFFSLLGWISDPVYGPGFCRIYP
ncbi:MAG: hypothetical protein LWW83_01185 [Azonexaceae bacterium]|uniref:hypothetical protein n=1 Tax=Azonexus sp. R2A61 TaxID=2744443 RepID=UPI001F259A36|nr:hypothetical protein [Azonexus sp. R2A61]MCE1238528.1 hypothetical protein [Azonexaceae bacterium]